MMGVVGNGRFFLLIAGLLFLPSRVFGANERINVAFVGDTLFARGIGRPDLPGGNMETLVRCIREKILTLDADTVVYPGHGPDTTVGIELAENPYLNKPYL